MTDWLTRDQRSRNMASIRSKGNRTTEARFVTLLRRSRISGWRRHLNLPGKPDFVFKKMRLAIFIDGCFWHGCPRCYRLPEDNRPYWRKKVLSNRRRDSRNAQRLHRKGWALLRFWEHSLKTEKDRRRVLARLERLISLSNK
jgi:DNA mismatch endonuclease, patch repair protein